jgi:hypothetical protein
MAAVFEATPLSKTCNDLANAGIQLCGSRLLVYVRHALLN